MTREELETTADVAREIIEKMTHEIETANTFTGEMNIRMAQNFKKCAETMLWLCDELRVARGW